MKKAMKGMPLASSTCLEEVYHLGKRAHTEVNAEHSLIMALQSSLHVLGVLSHMGGCLMMTSVLHHQL